MQHSKIIIYTAALFYVDVDERFCKVLKRFFLIFSLFVTFLDVFIFYICILSTGSNAKYTDKCQLL